ncbi:MAG: hypothetical protein IJM46_03685 [Oscillospiraceae bacterium]|nr:hypothetical protein [Oscillospiraceae bacterium]
MDEQNTMQNNPETAAEAAAEPAASVPLKSKAAKIIRSIFIVCAVILLFNIVLILLFLPKTFATTSTDRQNAQAKSIFNAALSYEGELIEAGESYAFHTTIFNKNDDTGKDSALYQRMRYYYGEIDNLNFAVVADEEGNITGSVCSRGKITEKTLSNLQTYDQQRKYMSSFFTANKAVSSYGLGFDSPHFN